MHDVFCVPPCISHSSHSFSSAQGVPCLAGTLLFELLEQQENGGELDLDAFCALEEMAAIDSNSGVSDDSDGGGGDGGGGGGGTALIPASDPIVVPAALMPTRETEGAAEGAAKPEPEPEPEPEVFDFSWPKELRGIHATPPPPPPPDPDAPQPYIRTWRRPANYEVCGEDALGEDRASRRVPVQKKRKTNREGKLKKVRFILPGASQSTTSRSPFHVLKLTSSFSNRICHFILPVAGPSR